MGERQADRCAQLGRVRWIGGPPDAGKSTVAALMGERHRLPVYHFDRQEGAHIARADPDRHPELFRLGRKLAELGEMAWVEEDWIHANPEEMARRAIGVWSERVDLAIEDLLTIPGDAPIIAEGPGFFPTALVPLLSRPEQAIFLIPTEQFKGASHARRGKSLGRGERTSDPARYGRNHIARDLLIADHYRATVEQAGLRAIEIDGARDAAAVAALVEEHCGLGKG